MADPERSNAAMTRTPPAVYATGRFGRPVAYGTPRFPHRTRPMTFCPVMLPRTKNRTHGAATAKVRGCRCQGPEQRAPRYRLYRFTARARRAQMIQC